MGIKMSFSKTACAFIYLVFFVIVAFCFAVIAALIEQVVRVSNQHVAVLPIVLALTVPCVLIISCVHSSLEFMQVCWRYLKK